MTRYLYIIKLHFDVFESIPISYHLSEKSAKEALPKEDGNNYSIVREEIQDELLGIADEFIREFEGTHKDGIVDDWDLDKVTFL